MMRPRRREFLFSGLLGLAGCRREMSRPNILFIMTDDHSAKHVGCYGNRRVRTPNMDRLAREGTRFTAALVNK